jgi:hypothetical protein
MKSWFLAKAVVTAVMVATLNCATAAEWGPMPSGVASGLDRVWGSGPNDVFAAGPGGVVLHYDGSTWKKTSTGTTTTLCDIWGTGPNDVFCVGWFGTILHYNGSAWSTMNSGSNAALYGVWGSGPNDVYAVGYARSLLHFDGSSWSTLMGGGVSNYFNDVWGFGPNEVFAVGDMGWVLHYNGSTWSPMPCGTGQELTGVWGTGPNDVFVATFAGKILHYDGTSWGFMPGENPSWWIYSFWGTGPNDVYVVGQYGTMLHWDGLIWSQVTVPTTRHLLGIWGSGPDDIFAVGGVGTILHYPARYFALTVTKRNGYYGRVDVDPNQTIFAPGQAATLRASGSGELAEWRSYLYDPNYPDDMNHATYGPPMSAVEHFGHWELDDPNHPGDGNYVIIDANNPITIGMNSNRQATAVFTCGSGVEQALPLLIVGLAVLGLGTSRRRAAT